MKQAIYITTTLPYVNGLPHIGHTVEFIRADILARYYRMLGHKVFFNTGADEHGQKIAEKAYELSQSPQEYVDAQVDQWKAFAQKIDMSYDYFSCTTDKQHKEAAQKLWVVCRERGYIYKSSYVAKYCVGCEMEKTDSELVDGRCADHPNRELELIDEENYFFAFSKLAEDLLELYKTRKDFVVPPFRLDEIQAFVSRGLRDFSISRLREKMSWGVAVPDDPTQVMYVWFDALTNYISCLGWGSNDESKYEYFWQNGHSIQLCGKDNLRQQSAIWQAMLLASGLEPTNTIFCEGHLTSGGTKMSKSVGNVVDPETYLAYYGVDAVRYFALRHIHNVQDSDWTPERFHEAYNSHLVNGLGNLASRILNMAEKYEVHYTDYKEVDISTDLKDFDFNTYGDFVWNIIGQADAYITHEEPFRKAKDNIEAARKDVEHLLDLLWQINAHLAPLMPQTHAKLTQAIKNGAKPAEPLFPRLEFNSEVL
ncbi:MAG: methionine--tRNA ligase [Patescibacteria group bacterium]